MGSFRCGRCFFFCVCVLIWTRVAYRPNCCALLLATELWSYDEWCWMGCCVFPLVETLFDWSGPAFCLVWKPCCSIKVTVRFAVFFSVLCRVFVICYWLDCLLVFFFLVAPFFGGEMYTLFLGGGVRWWSLGGARTTLHLVGYVYTFSIYLPKKKRWKKYTR